MTTRPLTFLALALALPLLSQGAEPLKQKVNLLDSIKSSKVTYHVNTSEKQTLKDPPDKIWSFMDNGQLKVSGKGFGYVRTNDVYRDYHLVIEYKFTGPTFGSRENKARDNGLFVHCHGPDGSYGGTWMAGIEAQIIEGGVGDILILSPKMPDGKELTTSVTAEIARDRDNEMIWKKGEPRQTVTKGRINWEKRDVDWKDEAGFRGRDDVESRLNEWTRMEVIAKGDTLQYFVNGVLVNECFECKPSEGYIFLQTEGAEMIVKRYELYPLGEYKEKWNPVSASGGSDVPVKKSREAAISPAESQKLIELDGPFEAQLVAAEPLVRDPVEITWDAQGRCYVADMIDYPLGPGPGKPPLSRIQQLIDDNKDGRYDRAITFADKMDHVQGLLPCKDGLIATTRTQILFMRDTNNDGVADERKPLVAGFNPNHSQLQVSAPRWGLDGSVYFNNGLDTKEIYPAGSTDQKQNFARCNLRWDPHVGKLEPCTGFGQFGGAFDDWGRHFFCSNRNPVMFAVMPYEAVIRNPNAGITQGWEDIAPSGAESRINPLAITHTTADAHAGTHTAACGLGVYRGDLIPELRGEIFVCEPTAQAVIRYHPEPHGASLKATRVGDHTEFFRSRDEWTRPVNVTTGPDGALYVCDMYRQYIDHARFFPESFSTTHDMRIGENEGRIYRIVPKHFQRSAGVSPVVSPGSAAKEPSKESALALPRPIEPAPQKVDELVAWLGHKNAWQRETAQRLLVERQEQGTLAALEKAYSSGKLGPEGKVHVMWTAIGLSRASGSPDMIKGRGTPFWFVGNISDKKDEVREQTVQALYRFPALSTQMDPGDDLRWMSSLVNDKSSRVRFLGILRARIAPPIFAAVASQSWPNSFVSLNERPQDPWLLKAALSSEDSKAGFLVSELLTDKPPMKDAALPPALLAVKLSELKPTPYSRTYSPEKAECLRSLASSSCANGDSRDVALLLSCLSMERGKLSWWKPALLQGIAEGLPKSKGSLGVKSLAELSAKGIDDPKGKALLEVARKSPLQVDRVALMKNFKMEELIGHVVEPFTDAPAEITALLAQVDKVLIDPAAPMEQRLAGLPLLAQRGWDKAEATMRTLLAGGQPVEISNAALALLKKFPADRTAPLLYELLPRLGPAARTDVVKMLTGNGKTVKDFFERIKRGEVPKSFVDAETRWRYLRPNNALYALAEEIFGKPSTDRAAVITSYSEALKMKGDPTRGHQVFSSVCIACHRLKGEGVDVAPDITDVKIKEKEALLSDILDPNRMVEARWMAYQVDTKDGRTVGGIVAAESSTEVTLKMAGGLTEAIPRTNIAKMKSLDASLMPVGLEAGISKEQMADLLAFLKGE